MLEPMSRSIHTGTGGTNLGSFRIRTAVLICLLALSSIAGAYEEPVVDSISVSGDLPVSISHLLDGTGLSTGSSLLRVTPTEAQAGIVYNLKALGYLDPEVTVTWPLWGDSERIVRIDIEPGTRSLLSGLVFEGVSIFAADSLASFYSGGPGLPITPSDTLDLRNSILDTYGERGYIHTSISIQLLAMEEGADQDEDGYRAIECILSEGPKSFLGSVSITGLETVRSAVVSRELLISSGDSLNMELLRLSISAIYQLGLFQDVRFTYAPRSNDSTLVDLDVLVSETNYRRIDLGTGYMSPKAIFGSASWLHPNIMGNNQKLSLSMYYMTYIDSDDGEKIEPDITYEEPWFLSTRWSWQLKFGYLYLRLPALYQKSWSVTSSFARDLTSHLRLTSGYSLEYEVYDEGEVGESSGEGWVTTSSIGASLVHDSRSPVLNARRGHWFLGSGKISGGILGGRDYFRLVAEARLYLPVSGSLTLAGRLRSGGAFPYGDGNSVPPDDRFFLGGGTSIRGYSFNSIGPKDDEGNPLGGRIELLGNFEVRADVIGDFGIVLFVDGGGLWNAVEDIVVANSGFGTGIGLRYNTVFGPIRLDYGFAPTWSNSLKRGKLYIGIGQVF